MLSALGDVDKHSVDDDRAAMLVLVLTGLIGLVGSLIVLLMVACRNSKGVQLPPTRSGWIPWLGAAVGFGKAPLHYIETCRQELGDIFTVHAAGKRMTFLCNQVDHAHFYQTPHADFQAAVQPFTERAAGIPFQSFYQHHTTIHDTIKGRLTPQYMTEMCPVLSEKFYLHLNERGKKDEGDLMDFVRSVMFPAVVCQLFGQENIKLTKEEMLTLQNTFAKYDLDFEYGAELPSFLLREWTSYKQWLLNFFTSMVNRMSIVGDKPLLLVEQLVKCVDGSSAPGYSLLLLWASQANAIPIAFWTLAFILSHPNVLSEIRQELSDWQLLNESGQFMAVPESKLKDFPTIKCALLETIRLRAPGTILRKVTKTHSIRGYTIPKGHLLMLSPYWSHRDPDLFPEPDMFNPNRWKVDDLLDKNQFLAGFNGFGGGRYHCPGRWFALMELQLMVAMTIKMFDMELLNIVPQPSPLHLVGSQQPNSQCRIRYERII